MITAYDAPFARFAEAAGIDMLLVGDTLGQVVLGHGTMPVDLVDMERHAAAVVRGTKRPRSSSTCRSARMKTNEEAVGSAIRLVKNSGVSSVKLE